jgi:methylenetetrahydrofolate reductase (NADPH)
MPITSAKQIKTAAAMSGAVLPAKYTAMIDRFQDNPGALKQAGIAYATEQIIDLIASGVRGIHIYTMNRPEVAGTIVRQHLGDAVGGGTVNGDSV